MPSRRPSLAALAALFALGAAGGCGKKDVPLIPEKVVGSCSYKNRFSGKQECRDYHGEWPAAKAESDCKDQENSQFTLGGACNIDKVLGYCILGGSDDLWVRVSLPGDNPGDCGGNLRGCEFFGGGAFDPAPICGGVDPDRDSGGTLGVFQPPVRSCLPPKPGEPTGKGEAGKVCTWEMISGATEEGRDFRDYASCDRVRTQRPYYPVPAGKDVGRDDYRLKDPTYVRELDWVKRQIRSTACTCCHLTSAPRGPSNWYLDAPGNFIDSFNPRGLAMGAGWIDTAGLGAYPKEQNNGFSRATPENPTHTVFVTTDDARMRKFFEAELLHRGLTRSQFADEKYVGGPIDEQRFFRPAACERGEGVAQDGTVSWRGGRSRYLYVLAADAASPTVPPNLDLPAGTLWRLDVPPDGTPLASGSVKYGQLPPGVAQRFPVAGAPARLEPGRQYYLHAAIDVLQPVTRCLFTAR